MSEEKKEAIVKKCPDCGYRIRGKNHNNGSHHASGGKGRKKGR